MITPENIIQLIKDTYNIDITLKNKKEDSANLRSIYFYLCTKYCNPTIYTYEKIGLAVNRKYSTVIIMTEKACEKINVKGWYDFNQVIKELDYLITEKYSEDEDYLNNIKLDNHDVLKLKRRVKEQDIRYRKLMTKYKNLELKLKQ